MNDVLSEVLSTILLFFPFILPFAGVGIIEAYPDNKLGRLTGIFLLKQFLDNILAFPIVFAYASILNTDGSSAPRLALVLLFFVPALLILAIIVLNRHLFWKSILPWLLLFGDLFCWAARITGYEAFSGDRDELLGIVSLSLLTLYPLLIVAVFLASHFYAKRKIVEAR